jgi:hypothetical protein
LDSYGFDNGERIRLVVSFTSSDGSRYEAGWTGTISPLTTSIAECRATDRYEINLDDDSSGRDRGMIVLPSTYFERISETRKEGELRQGDRVKLVTAFRGDQALHESGQTGTVINTRTKPDLISHDIALDFDETITVPRNHLERIPDDYAKVIWSDVDGVTVNFSGGSAV